MAESFRNDGADDAPYLSIVAASRNDDHGGNLLARMQVFIDGLIDQCRRFDIPAELILVEWNPPKDRSKLADALSWPAEPGPLAVRIIEVAPEIHARFEHAEALPLFQMIAKNVGIHRARGEFVLATNIDILFSDQLMEQIAARKLSGKYLYRIDRHDVDEAVLTDDSGADKLDFCEKNVIRVNRRDGTLFSETGDFDRIYKSRLKVLAWAVALTLVFPILIYQLYKFFEWRFTKPKDGFRKRELFYGLKKFLRLQARKRPKGTWNSFEAIRMIIGVLVVSFWRRILRRPLRGMRRRAWREVVFEFRRRHLHTNACGDFTLLSRDHWSRLRGYAEFEMYSFHIDGLLCHSAACLGIGEHILEDPARIYHMEHSEGSGFTPETQQALWRRIAKSKIERLSDNDFWTLTLDMQTKKRSPIFNNENWGLIRHDLPETDPTAPGMGQGVAKAASSGALGRHAG